MSFRWHLAQENKIVSIILAANRHICPCPNISYNGKSDYRFSWESTECQERIFYLVVPYIFYIPWVTAVRKSTEKKSVENRDSSSLCGREEKEGELHSALL